MPTLFFDEWVSPAEMRALGGIPQEDLAPLLANLKEIRVATFVSDCWRSFLIILVCTAALVLYRMKKVSMKQITGRSSPLAMGDLLRERAARILCETAGDEAGIIRAMLLGDRSDLESEVRSIFSDGGISHILAVSGLHISIFGMGLFDAVLHLFQLIF